MSNRMISFTPYRKDKAPARFPMRAPLNLAEPDPRLYLGGDATLLSGADFNRFFFLFIGAQSLHAAGHGGFRSSERGFPAHPGLCPPSGERAGAPARAARGGGRGDGRRTPAPRAP